MPNVSSSPPPPAPRASTWVARILRSLGQRRGVPHLSDRFRWLLLIGAILLGTVSAYVPFSMRVTALREGRATGPSWTFPGRVYSDAVPLIVGRMLPVEYLEAELDARGYRQVPAARRPGSFEHEGDRFDIVLRGFTDVPDPDGRESPERVRLRIQEGRLVSVERAPFPGGDEPAAPAGRGDPPARLEPMRIALLYDEQPTWRTWVDLDRVPQTVRDAIIASEDRRFRSHMGLDLRGYLRALVTNMRAGQVRQGGSTITQQLARSLFLGNDRTLGRKLAEVPIALGLEMVLGKQKILEMYLNSVYWGQAGSTSVGGIEAAARWYFDEPVEDLGPLEGATLAAIIPAPNVFDPFKRPKVVRARRDQVLRDMASLHWLSEERAASLARQPLEVRHGAPPADPFPSYSGFVSDQLRAKLPGPRVTRQGLAIFTRMDLVWQSKAQATLGEGVAALDDGSRGPRIEGAFVALEPGTGAIRAMVGGRSPATGSFNRAYQARRQTGSAIKPIVYAAALSSGRGLTAASTVPDEPISFPTDRGMWAPHNDDGQYHSQVTLVKALERSINVATTNVVQLVGPAEVARVAARFGLVNLKPVLSIGLGSYEATLLDLTRAFAVFLDEGWLVPPSSLRAVTDRAGHLVLERPPGTTVEPGLGRVPAGATRALPASIAALMTGMLTDVVRFGVAYPLRSTFQFLRPAAGKTGTTDDYRDGWFVGFTPDIVAGVWVGYDRPRSMGRLAATTALPTWAHVVPPLLEGFPERPFASDSQLEWHNVEPWTGLLGTPFCSSQPTPFLPSTAPRRYCEPSLPLEPEPADSLGGGEDSTDVSEP